MEEEDDQNTTKKGFKTAIRSNNWTRKYFLIAILNCCRVCVMRIHTSCRGYAWKWTLKRTSDSFREQLLFTKALYTRFLNLYKLQFSSESTLTE
jgi:hypothetical protein